MIAQAEVEGGNPSQRVFTLGDEGHGRTTLVAAITQVLAKTGGARAVSREQLDPAPKEVCSGVTFTAARVEYQLAKRRYTQVDPPLHTDCVRGLLLGATKSDVGVLVVSADKGPTSRTKEQLLIARGAGIEHVVVFVNKVDLVDEVEEKLRSVEEEVRAVLRDCGFPGDTTSIVPGSAKKALEGEVGRWGEPAIQGLLEALERDPPAREPDASPFLLVVRKATLIGTERVTMTGRVERGGLKVGDEVEVLRSSSSRTTVVTDIQGPDGALGECMAGDEVCVSLQDLLQGDLQCQMVLAKPGSIRSHPGCAAWVHMLAMEEGGGIFPLSLGILPTLRFHGTDVPALIAAPESQQVLSPGRSLPVTMRLYDPQVMEKGTRFTLRKKGGRTVGIGVVTGLFG